MREIRHRMLAEYGKLYEAVNMLFFEIDPFALNYGINTDEYEREVWEVLPQLKASNTEQEIFLILETACRKFFSKPTVNEGLGRLGVLAAKIKETL